METLRDSPQSVTVMQEKRSAISIQEHPAYVCNQIALRLGVVASLISAVATLFYPGPNNISLSAMVVMLGVVFAASRQYLLPKVRTSLGLDLVVIGYMAPIMAAQWMAIAYYPSIEVSTGAACLIVLSGLLFSSTISVLAMSLFSALAWVFVKWSFSAPPSPNELAQLVATAPIIALIARLAVVRSHSFLQDARQRERANVAELQRTLEQLRMETRLRERSEAQLILAQKNESLGLMAAGVAHDFNNMLSVINSLSTIIETKSDQQPVKAHAKEIANAVQHASAVCRQMLVYAGKSTSQMLEVDLVKLVRDLHPLMQASATLRVFVRIEADIESAIVLGNEGQLQQVLMNLVANGADAIEHQGSVVIRIGRTSISPDPKDSSDRNLTARLLPGDYFFVTIADTGRGMSPEIIRQMFDPYFTTKGTSHGFGLSTVLGICKSHRIVVEVFSQIEAGTRITLYFQPLTTIPTMASSPQGNAGEPTSS